MAEGAEAVRSWTARKQINLFDKRLIFVPVNKDLHWSLCVVVNPGAIAAAVKGKTGIDDPIPCLLFFDSLKSHDRQEISQNIQEWLNNEWKTKKDTLESPFTNKSFQIFSPTGTFSKHVVSILVQLLCLTNICHLLVPIQTNSVDCGVFLCRFAYALYQLRFHIFTYVDAGLDRTSKDKSKSKNKPFYRVITKGAEFDFNKNDMPRIREEFKTLIERLSALFLRAKQAKLSEKRKGVTFASQFSVKSFQPRAVAADSLHPIEMSLPPRRTRSSTQETRPVAVPTMAADSLDQVETSVLISRPTRSSSQVTQVAVPTTATAFSDESGENVPPRRTRSSSQAAQVAVPTTATASFDKSGKTVPPRRTRSSIQATQAAEPTRARSSSQATQAVEPTTDVASLNEINTSFPPRQQAKGSSREARELATKTEGSDAWVLPPTRQTRSSSRAAVPVPKHMCQVAVPTTNNQESLHVRREIAVTTVPTGCSECSSGETAAIETVIDNSLRSCGHSTKNRPCKCDLPSPVCQRCCGRCGPKSHPEVKPPPRSSIRSRAATNAIVISLRECGHSKKNPSCKCNPPTAICQRCCDGCRSKNAKEELSSNASPWIQKLNRESRIATIEAIEDTRMELSFDFGGDTVHDEMDVLSSSLDMSDVDIDGEGNILNSSNPKDNKLGFRMISELLGLDTKYIPLESSGKVSEKPKVLAELKRRSVLALNTIIDSFASYETELPDEIRQYAIERLVADAKSARTDKASENDDSLCALELLFSEDKKGYSVFGDFSDDAESVKKQRDAFLFGSLDLIDGQKRHSSVARAARALVVCALPKKDADIIFDRVTQNKWFGQKARHSACEDLRKAFSGDRLKPTPRTAERVSEACLVYAVTCMLSTENVGLWSWGEKVVSIETHGGKCKEQFELLKIFLRKSIQDIWEDYLL